jgi:hypothetical protein
MLFHRNVPPLGLPVRTIGVEDVAHAVLGAVRFTLGDAVTVAVIESVAKQPADDE